MRLGTYNIKDGGLDFDGTSRLEEIAGVIDGLRLDVLAVQECNRFGDNRSHRLRWFGRRLRMRSHLLRTRSGFDLGICVDPSVDVVRRGGIRSGFTHGAGYVDVRMPEGDVVRVINVHLDPFDGDQRLREIGVVLRRLAVGANVVIMGDLNSVAAADVEHCDVSAWSEEARRRYLLPGTDRVDTRVGDALEAAGFTDVVASAHPGSARPSVPTERCGGAEFAALRLDQVFVRGRLAGRVVNAEVVSGGEVEAASDHRPVAVEIV